MITLALAHDIITSDYWATRVHVAPNGCWLWTGSLSSSGYPQCRYAGRRFQAHRVSLTIALGRTIHPGMEAGHVCHDRAYAAGQCTATSNNPCNHRRCVNPNHVQEQDHRTNTLAAGSPSAVNARKTHCPNGHPLAGDNLRISKERRGERGCRQCDVDEAATQTAAVRAAARSMGLTVTQYQARFGRSAELAADLAQAADQRQPALFNPNERNTP